MVCDNITTQSSGTNRNTTETQKKHVLQISTKETVIFVVVVDGGGVGKNVGD